LIELENDFSVGRRGQHAFHIGGISAVIVQEAGEMCRRMY
jgi:hypothetical protein